MKLLADREKQIVFTIDLMILYVIINLVAKMTRYSVSEFHVSQGL